MTNQCCAFTFSRPEALRIAFDSGCKHLVEVAENNASLVANILDDTQRTRISLFTHTAYHHRIAREVSREIHVQHPDTTLDAIQSLETALHETISNAVIHGNLGLKKNFQNQEQLQQFYQDTRERLEEERYALKRIHIDFWTEANHVIGFSVTDEGEGFDYEAVLAPRKPEACDPALIPQNYGMGLILLSKLCDSISFCDEGRTISLRFSLNQKPFGRQMEEHTPIAMSERRKHKILLVDELDYNRHIIRNVLMKEGYESIIEAESGSEALSILERHTPSLIICNIQMAQIDGLTLCQTIRNKPEFLNIPILIQSTLTDVDRRIQALRSGANNLIEQPIHSQELLARIEMHLSQHQSYQQLQEYRSRIESEIELARQMHISLIPSQSQLDMIEKETGILISNYFQPSSEIGGDIWGVMPLENSHEIGFYICDFTGHGMSAAINTFRFHTALDALKELASDPGKLLTALNQDLYEMLPVTQFATFFYGVINTQDNSLRYAAAGAPTPILHAADPARCKLIDSSGIPLGIVTNHCYITSKIEFRQSDTFMIYSDALTETESNSGVFLNEEFIQQQLSEHSLKDPKRGHKTIIRDFLMNMGVFDGKQCSDDLTIALFTRLH